MNRSAVISAKGVKAFGRGAAIVFALAVGLFGEAAHAEVRPTVRFAKRNIETIKPWQPKATDLPAKWDACPEQAEIECRKIAPPSLKVNEEAALQTLLQVRTKGGDEKFYLRKLPMAIQSLVNKTYAFQEFIPAKNSPVDFPEARGGSYHSSSNCFNTAYEVLRLWDVQLPESLQYEIMFYSEPLFAELIKDKFDEVQELKSGDLVTFADDEGEIMHAAVYVGNGLVFEKPNFETTHPFRLARLEDVKTYYNFPAYGKMTMLRRRVGVALAKVSEIKNLESLEWRRGLLANSKSKTSQVVYYFASAFHGYVDFGIFRSVPVSGFSPLLTTEVRDSN